MTSLKAWEEECNLVKVDVGIWEYFLCLTTPEVALVYCISILPVSSTLNR